MAEGLAFRRVAHRSAGAVRFDQFDGGRIDARGSISPLDGRDLAFDTRSEHALGASVAGDADTFQDGVDLVVVALGFGQALEHHHADAFAEKSSIRARVEGPHDAFAGKRFELREDHHQDGRGIGMHAARQREIAAAGLKFVHAMLDGDEARSASRVHKVIRTHQIEPVGDAAGDYVGNQARGSVGLELRRALLEMTFNECDFLGGVLGMKLLEDAQGGFDHHALLHGRRIAAIHIGAAPQDDGGALLHLGKVGGTGIGQSFVGHAQGHVMIRLAAIHRAGEHAVSERVELGQLAQVAAALAVSAVVFGGIGIPEKFGFPIGRRISHRIHFVEDILPVLARIGRAGKDARHADNGDLGGAVFGGRCG